MSDMLRQVGQLPRMLLGFPNNYFLFLELTEWERKMLFNDSHVLDKTRWQMWVLFEDGVCKGDK